MSPVEETHLREFINVKFDDMTTWVEKIEKSVERIQRTLDGEDGRFGMKSKVMMLWKSWVWILCTLSAGVGSLATWLLMRSVQ